MTKCTHSLIRSPHAALKCFILRGINFHVHLRTSHAKMDPHFSYTDLRGNSNTLSEEHDRGIKKQEMCCHFFVLAFGFGFVFFYVYIFRAG